MLAYFLVVCYSLSRVIFAPAFPCKPACGEKRGVYEKSALRAHGSSQMALAKLAAYCFGSPPLLWRS